MLFCFQKFFSMFSSFLWKEIIKLRLIIFNINKGNNNWRKQKLANMHKLQKTKKRSQLKEQRHNFTFNFVGNINNAASRSDKSTYSEQNNKLTWQSDKNSSRNPIFLSCTSSVFSRRSQRVSADLRSQWLTKKCHVWKLLFVSSF